MARKFLTPIDLNKNELQNVAIQNLASDPATPATGQIYYNTGGSLKLYNGTSWQVISTGTITALTFKSDGTGAAADSTFDGSTARNISYNSIGAAPTASPTFTGTITTPLTTAGIVLTNGSGALSSTATIADSYLANISTAGKVLNSATTAATANGASTIVSRDASGNFAANTITANLTGTASSATALATPRAINGVNFDGSAAITVTANAGTLTHTTLASGVTASSLTSVGTLNGLTIAATQTVSMGGNKITNVGTPAADSDAATKLYVDSTAQGIDWKASVRAATTTNGTLSTAYANGSVIDDVTLVTGNRILIKNQTTGSENGIYTVNATGAPTRAIDADTATEISSAFAVFVEEGTDNADSGFVLTNNGTVTVGTTALTFTQFTGLGQVTAGNGLTKTGNTLNAVGTADRITANADSIDIASTYAGQSTIVTLGNVTTGTWSANVIAGQYGGTGVNNSGKTITLGGNLTTSGAFATTLTATATTSVTLPTGGTLANTAVTLTSGSILKGNGNSEIALATGTDITTAISTNPVQLATNLTTYTFTSGASGASRTINGQTSSNASGTGGSLTFAAGDATGATLPVAGSVSINAGTANSSINGAAGNVTIDAGAGGANNGNGYIFIGTNNTGTVGVAGSADILYIGRSGTITNLYSTNLRLPNADVGLGSAADTDTVLRIASNGNVYKATVTTAAPIALPGIKATQITGITGAALAIAHASVATGTGNAITIASGDVTASSGSAGALTLNAGNITGTTASGSAGGAVSITGGNVTSTASTGTGGAVSITGGSNTQLNSNGGGVTITAGSGGTGTGAAGNISIQGGAGSGTRSTINIGTTNSTAAINIGTQSINAGTPITIGGGTALNNSIGAIAITGHSTSSTAGSGAAGAINITGGASTGATGGVTGGPVTINGGLSTAGTAGALNLNTLTVASTTNIATGVLTAGTKAVNIGTAATGGTTTIAIGSATGTTTTLNGTVAVLGGKTTLAVHASGYAGLNIPSAATTLSSPASGDIWNLSGVLQFNTGAATKQIAFTDGNITGSAGSVANSLVIKSDSGTTEGTDLYTFNGSASKTLNLASGTGVTIAETAGTFTFNNSGVTSVNGSTGALTGFTKKYAENNGALTATSGVVTWTVTHNLNTSNVTVQIYQNSTNASVEVDVVTTSVNVVTLTFNSATLTGSEYRVVVIG